MAPSMKLVQKRENEPNMSFPVDTLQGKTWTASFQRIIQKSKASQKISERYNLSLTKTR